MRRDRLGGPHGHATDCQCGGIRGVRYRQCTDRRQSTTSSCSRSVCAFISASRLCQSSRGIVSGSSTGASRLVLREILGIAAEENVGTAAGHVRRYRNGAFTAGLRHDRGFARVVFRIQNLMRDAHLAENLRQHLGFFNRYGADENGLAFVVQFLDELGGVPELLLFRPIHDILEFLPDHRFIGRNRGDFELIDLVEFLRFRFGCTGHAGQLLVHAEVILERDRRESLILAFDLDAFLCFDGLMETVAPAAARHDAAGELVDDDDLAVLHQVILVAMKRYVRFNACSTWWRTFMPSQSPLS